MANQRKAPVRTTRMPKAKLAPQAIRLSQQGWTKKEIATKLGRSERYVYELLKYGKHDGSAIVQEIPDFVPYGGLDPKVQERIRFKASSFQAFFNAYSGKTLSPIHRKWVEEAVNTERLLVNCPPRHAKSTIFSVWFPIWLIAGAHACLMNPADPDAFGLRNVQILLVSQTDKLAKKFTNEISYHLSYNQKLIADFGRFKPEMGDWPWRPNSGELLVDMRSRETESGDMTMQVRGAGQQILGMEANWVIVDDPVSREVARSETEREKLSEWFHGDVMTRLEPKGRAICIGQRLHIHDLYGDLSDEKTTLTNSRKRWTHINYPAILDWDSKQVLWPEKWAWDDILQVYQDIGSDIFESMYQQNPLATARRLARTEWLYGDDEHPGCVDVLRQRGEGLFDAQDEVIGAMLSRTPREEVVRVVSLDPSPTRYAGLIVADVPRLESQFSASIIEIIREKMSVRDMLSNLERVQAMYSPDYFIFEQVAAQRWFLQDQGLEKIKQEMTVLPHNTGRNKGDPVLGVESLALDFEFGRIRFPYGDAESKAMSEQLFDEARTYPQGKTDDLLMALWFIKFNYIRLVPRYKGQGGGGFGRNIPNRLKGGWEWWAAAKAKEA